MHSPQGFADSEEQNHEPPLGEARVVDEVGVDHILEIAAAVVWEQNVYGLSIFVGAALGGYCMIMGGDDGRDVGKKAVGVDLAHSLLDGLGAKGTSNLLEGEQLMG